MTIVVVFFKHTHTWHSSPNQSIHPKNGPIYSPHTFTPHLSAPLVAGNLPWPTNNRLARETEISGLSEILLRLQCGRDDPKLALVRRHTTLDILDER